jgi:hypothetical protein
MTMMKHYLLILTCLVILRPVFSQDKIVKKDGQVIPCKITLIDSSTIKFFYSNEDICMNTYAEKKDILFYKYKGVTVYLQTKQIHQASPEFADSIENLNRNFLYTYMGDIIYGRIIDHKTPFLGRSRFEVDSKEIQPDIVTFYKNETGFYANTKEVNSSGSSIFTVRIRKGRINLYEKETTNYSPGYFSVSTGMYYGGYITKTIKNYYNKGFGELKKANYKNLRTDLANDPESMLYLDKYKSISSAQTVLQIVGGGLIVVGFATLINNTKDWHGSDKQSEPNVTGNIVTIFMGGVCFLTSYCLSFSKPKQLRKAFDAYNK